MRRLPGYPNWFLPALLLSSTLLALTGITLIPSMLEFKFDIDLSWQLPSGYRVLQLGAHAALGYAVLIALGSLLPIHARAGWRKRKNHVSGAMLVLALASLALTALGLYYAGSDTGQKLSALVHTAVGLLFTFACIFHSLKGEALHRQHPELPRHQQPS